MSGLVGRLNERPLESLPAAFSIGQPIICINMAASPDDWRLTNQVRYLQGAVLHWSQWTRPHLASDHDHDHCEFCWAKFMEEKLPEVMHFGYTTVDRYRWVCEQCFEDFKDHF